MWLQPISTLYNYSAYSLLVGKSVLLKHFVSCSVQFRFSVYNQNYQTLDCIPEEAIKVGFAVSNCVMVQNLCFAFKQAIRPYSWW
jgi:hypothetical protein